MNAWPMQNAHQKLIKVFVPVCLDSQAIHSLHAIHLVSDYFLKLLIYLIYVNFYADQLLAQLRLLNLVAPMTMIVPTTTHVEMRPALILASKTSLVLLWPLVKWSIINPFVHVLMDTLDRPNLIVNHVSTILN